MTQLTVSELTDRAEISDVIQLFCQTIDHHDWDGMDALFHDDAEIRYSYRDYVQPYREWSDNARVTLAAFTRTFHQIGNMLIEIDGDTAVCETYVTALHLVPPTAPTEGFWAAKDEPYNGIGGARYLDRFERRDGRWKIAVRETIVDWRYDAPARHEELLQVDKVDPAN